MAWFVARPEVVFLVRWEGDVAVTGDPGLPSGYRYAVDDGDGSLLVTDARDRVRRVPPGSWFVGSSVLEDARLRATYQEVSSVGPWTYAVTGV